MKESKIAKKGRGGLLHSRALNANQIKKFMTSKLLKKTSSI
jgi:hypothetical protein